MWGEGHHWTSCQRSLSLDWQNQGLQGPEPTLASSPSEWSPSKYGTAGQEPATNKPHKEGSLLV